MQETEYMTAHLTAPADPGEMWLWLFFAFLVAAAGEIAWWWIGYRVRVYVRGVRWWYSRCVACEQREAEHRETIDTLRAEVLTVTGEKEHLIDMARRKGFLRDLMLPEDEYAEEQRQRNRHGVHADFQQWQEEKRWEERARDDGDFEINYDIKVK